MTFLFVCFVLVSCAWQLQCSLLLSIAPALLSVLPVGMQVCKAEHLALLVHQAKLLSFSLLDINIHCSYTVLYQYTMLHLVAVNE